LNVIETIGRSGLLQRPARANNMNADLFISVHHDSVRDNYLMSWQYQGEQHFFLDQFKGFSLFVSGRNARYEESVIFAKMLADQLLTRGLVFTTHHEPNNPAGRRAPFVDPTRGIYRFDDFAVLRFAQMPAVILEAGVIVNRAEEQVLSSSVRRAVVATAVTEAIERFCSAPRVSGYRVIDVSPDDVLNMRSGPAANLSIVGTIPPNGRGVQLAGPCDNNWCMVDYNGIRGWVNRRFLSGE
jgi:hypothetical protein